MLGRLGKSLDLCLVLSQGQQSGHHPVSLCHYQLVLRFHFALQSVEVQVPENLDAAPHAADLLRRLRLVEQLHEVLTGFGTLLEFHLASDEDGLVHQVCEISLAKPQNAKNDRGKLRLGPLQSSSCCL